MGSIFGGAQSVPTSQATNQNVAQNAVQTTAANQLAQGLGGSLLNDLTTFYNTTGNIPVMQTVPMTSMENAALNNATNWANTGYSLAPQMTNYLNQAGNYLGQGGDFYNTGAQIVGQAPGLINQGAGLESLAGTPITGADVAGFYNPFASNVTANLQSIFGQQDLANRIGATRESGGVGAERAAVGQALLAQQQGLTAGGVYADLYQRALQAAQQQKAQQLGAGQGLVGAGGAMVGAGQGMYGAGQGLAGIGQQFGGLGLGIGGFGLNANQQALTAAQYQAQRLQQPNIAQYQWLEQLYQNPLVAAQAMTAAMPGLIGLGQTGTQDVTGTQQALGFGATTYPAPSLVSQVAGLGTLGAGLYGLLSLSDPRAKTDVQKMGYDRKSGLPMYAFRYKGDPKSYPKVVGPMATDVEKKYPSYVRHLNLAKSKYQDGGPVMDLSYGDVTNAADYDQGQGSQDQSQDQGQDQSQDSGSSTSDLDQRAQQAQQQLSRQKRAQEYVKMLQQLQASQQTFRNLASQKTRGIQFPVTPWRLGSVPMPKPLGGVFGTQSRGGRAYQGGGTVGGGGLKGSSIASTAAPTFNQKLPDYLSNWLSTAGAAPNSPATMRTYDQAMRVYDQPLNYQNLYNAARTTLLGGTPTFEQSQPAPVESQQPIPVPPAPTPDTNPLPVKTRDVETGPSPLVVSMWGPGHPVKRGGRIKRFQDGGPVDEIESLATQLEGDEDEHEPPGMPTQESIPLPSPRPSGDIPGAPFAPGRGGGLTAGLTGMYGKQGVAGSTNPYMALMQAGLGMLAASGQRDARGLPMSPLGAIGQGGLLGVQSYQQGLQQAQKDLLARQQMDLRERALSDLMAHRRALESVPRITGTDKWGNPIRERYNPISKQYEPIKSESAVAATTQPVAAFTPGTLRSDVAATAEDAAKLSEQEGEVPANARLVQHGQYDYATGAPPIQKGYDVPNPAPIEGPVGVQSPRQQMQDAANYLETGKLPSVSRGNSPVARQQQTYQNAVKNYAGALAESQGLSVQELASKWRKNPYAMRWILGWQGRSATSMGTTMRHLDSLEQAYGALKNGNIQLFNEMKARFGIAVGVPEPVALNAMRQIVGTEIIKGLGVAAGGTREERAEAAAAYSAKLSPDQFNVTKSAVSDLLAGQLEGRQGEARNAGVTDADFERQVGAKEYERLQKLVEKRRGGTFAPAFERNERPIPTDKDRAFGKSGKPGALEQFKNRFGVEP